MWDSHQAMNTSAAPSPTGWHAKLHQSWNFQLPTFQVILGRPERGRAKKALQSVNPYHVSNKEGEVADRQLNPYSSELLPVVAGWRCRRGERYSGARLVGRDHLARTR
jgi:hypothetical protein